MINIIAPIRLGRLNDTCEIHGCNRLTGRFQSGRALRIAMLDRLIARMKTLPGVWFPTCEQVARYCLDRHPPRAGAL